MLVVICGVYICVYGVCDMGCVVRCSFVVCVLCRMLAGVSYTWYAVRA